MAEWSNKYEKCQQCGTKRFRPKAKGFCTRCYPLLRLLEQVSHWDPTDPSSLTGYIKGMTWRNAEEFEQIKSGVASQIRERLYFLRIREEKLDRPIYGLEVENEFRYVAARCGVRDKGLFYGIAGVIDHFFDMDQKKILYELLNDIRENVAWQGIDWIKVRRSNRRRKG